MTIEDRRACVYLSMFVCVRFCACIRDLVGFFWGGGGDASAFFSTSEEPGLWMIGFNSYFSCQHNLAGNQCVQ